MFTNFRNSLDALNYRVIYEMYDRTHRYALNAEHCVNQAYGIAIVTASF